MAGRTKPASYRERTYRRAVSRHRGWSSFTVRYQQTDLWIQADRDLRAEAERILLEARIHVERYAGLHDGFLTSHSPLPADPRAPPLVMAMLEGGIAAGVGPMAAVARAIAQHVGEQLLLSCTEVVVENGGDIFIRARRPIRVGIFAGESPLSGKLAICVDHGAMPVGIATSSSSVGHSWSYGAADAACVVADHAALADAAATALGNRVRCASDLEPALAWVLGLEGVRGALIVIGTTMAAQGDVELVSVQ